MDTLLSLPLLRGRECTPTRSYLLNGQLIALRTGSESVTYLHRDQVGSVVMTTQDGAITDNRLYFAYGSKRGGDEYPFEPNYTGQRKDDTGLLYYGARYYDPALGMFISPDSVIPAPTDFFSYNRYLYARGNPLSNNDPSGHRPNNPRGPLVPVSWYASGGSASEYALAQSQLEAYRSDPELFFQDDAASLRYGYAFAYAENVLNTSLDHAVLGEELAYGMMMAALFDLSQIPTWVEDRSLSRDYYLGRLPVRTSTDQKTEGYLIVNGRQYHLFSGEDGPGFNVPPGTPGFNGNVRTHVEVHSAAVMRDLGADNATPYVNNMPCAGTTGCDYLLPRMLPEGASLRVVGPNRFDKVYTGVPD